MKAVVGETVVAEAASEAVISIEGNAYFSPDSVVVGALRNSPTPYICPWKGRAQYHDVVVGETVLRDGASQEETWLTTRTTRQVVSPVIIGLDLTPSCGPIRATPAVTRPWR